MDKHLDSYTPEWEYKKPAPRGVKLSLLTIGNQQVTGDWSADGRYKAWAPLIKRNKDIERELGYL